MDSTQLLQMAVASQIVTANAKPKKKKSKPTKRKTRFESVPKLVKAFLDQKTFSNFGKSGRFHYSGNGLFCQGVQFAILSQFNGRPVVLKLASKLNYKAFGNSKHKIEEILATFGEVISFGGEATEKLYKNNFSSEIISATILHYVLAEQDRVAGEIFEDLDENPKYKWHDYVAADPENYWIRDFNKTAERLNLSYLAFDPPKEFVQFFWDYATICEIATDQTEKRKQEMLWSTGRRRRRRW